MNHCQRIDALMTPYVDGDIRADERDLVEAHLRACRLCQGRVHAEQAVRALVRTRRSQLELSASPPTLRAYCVALGHSSVTVAPVAVGWRTRAMPFALAAGLVLFVGGAFLYELTERSTTVMAAELTADHVKCFRTRNPAGQPLQASAVESSMAARFAWRAHLPEHPEQAGLQLVGALSCLYGEGRTAHLMYRHNGEPVSIFMLPKSTRGEERIEILGHQASIWSMGDRTFVLIAREPAADVDRMAAFVHAALR